MSIINNVLDMARIESGKVELSEDYVKISSMLREFYDVFGEEAQQKGITFCMRIMWYTSILSVMAPR